MQDFIDQAKKKGIELLTNGNCQFCGAQIEGGIFECLENYNEGLGHIDFSISENHIYKFLSVDAHALQHPEIHGRWSNHFHLTRLCLIIDKGQNWNYGLSPKLSDYLNDYKNVRPNETLIEPLPKQRGNLTTKHLAEMKNSKDAIEFIKKWANEVYQSWSINHPTIMQIAEGYLNGNRNLSR